MKNNDLRIAVILGGLSALGPLAIDMYLPAFPAIAADLNTDSGSVQFSLMTFFAGLMLGQLFYGPISDRTGRKPMIFVGLALFIVASLGCALSFDIHHLIAWRFVQGLGGSIGTVIGLAVVRDLYSGRAAARLMSLMMIVLGVAPIFAPIIGTGVMAIAPWRALFAVHAGVGVAAILLVAFFLPETRLSELRMSSRPLHALSHYWHLIVSRRYIPFVLTSSLSMGGFFAYLAGSSFVFMSVHGLSPVAYSVLFAMNSIGLIAGAQSAPLLVRRFEPQNVVRGAVVVAACAALTLLVLEMRGGAPLVPLIVLLFIVVATMGFVMPLCGLLALESYGAISGTASALVGAFQFGAGTLISFLVGLAADGTGLPMAAAIALCSVAACGIAFLAFPKPLPVTT